MEQSRGHEVPGSNWETVDRFKEIVKEIQVSIQPHRSFEEGDEAFKLISLTHGDVNRSFFCCFAVSSV